MATQRHHHIELNALCTFQLAKADYRVQLRFQILLHRVNSCTVMSLSRINCGGGSTTICERQWQGRASIYVGGVSSQSSSYALAILGVCDHTKSVSGARLPTQIFVTRGDHLGPDSSGLFVLVLRHSSFPPEWPAFNTHASPLLSQSYPIHLSVMAKPDDAHWVAGSATIPSAWACSSGIPMPVP